MSIEITVRKILIPGSSAADTIIHDDGEPLSNVNAAAQLAIIAAGNLALAPLNPGAAGVVISAGFAAITTATAVLIDDLKNPNKNFADKAADALAIFSDATFIVGSVLNVRAGSGFLHRFDKWNFCLTLA